MINHLKYTTNNVKERIIKFIDKKDIKEEEKAMLKDVENKKQVISDDAFALCDLIHNLTQEIKKNG